MIVLAGIPTPVTVWPISKALAVVVSEVIVAEPEAEIASAGGAAAYDSPAPGAQEVAFGVELLDAVVGAPVDDVDVAFRVHRDSQG